MPKWLEKAFDITVVEGVVYLLLLAFFATLVDVVTPWDLRAAFVGWGTDLAGVVIELVKAVREALAPAAT